ncbi:N-(5'-phosphoribosyl)anthranilate isomerase [Candidatus Vallotia cooleyia]|nr:phosphoribosylanthranilate isomerase [Candidatus Vallotia cooleyia]UDG82355.1 N-(5'-phosphoribosyl)anthranilate isomerase [Candidatus Vallotia cooleyia]
MTKPITASTAAFTSRVRHTRVKLCGLSTAQDVDYAVALGADAIGLVFYPPSPRCVSIERAAALARRVPAFVLIVGLFVNADDAMFKQVLDSVPLSMVQFHGDETPLRCATLTKSTNLRWLRALRVGPNTQPTDLVKSSFHYANATGLVLDTWVDSYGGGGKAFDWSLIPADIANQAILSGGLNTQNVADAIYSMHPYAVDVSSGIEVPGAKGVKDHVRMAAFIDTVRATDTAIEATGV